ncbi:hypothetical protein C5167_000288 [Papaver somniferum]|uniref:Leucine-rich repeat-containing N-terminal plant-type domain-containing protein n=1 Tax=Papaver somniferum TaxID=3469 RepID=A0A4Y7KTM3_PAPSO|nr:probable LRR receptor-like serine/threonine-protein kinase At1g05700 [Papaver somniferum]RZC76206.1 hypothetical protein C5167_000288 [Papaver somniferum]
MKNIKVNLVHFLLALSFSSLFLTISAQTNKTDAEALGLLLTTFEIVSTVDPCLPTPLPGIECSSDATPRIISLNISGAGLFTMVLPDFSAMDALEIIDFSDNIIVQEFPDFLANFPKLKVLNLANNFLFGTVPTSLLRRLIENTLELTLTGTGMVNLCFSDEEKCRFESPAGAPETQPNFGRTFTTFSQPPPSILGDVGK